MAARKQNDSQTVENQSRKPMIDKTVKSAMPLGIDSALPRIAGPKNIAEPTTVAEKVEQLRSRGFGGLEIKTAKSIKELQIGLIYAPACVAVEVE